MAPRSKSDQPEEVARKQRNDLAKIRRGAMALMSRLIKPSQLPEEEKARLLGKNGGVIGGFNTLGQLVTRVVDKECQVIASASAAQTELDEDETALDQRLADELDRLAAEGKEANLVEAGGENPERQD